MSAKVLALAILVPLVATGCARDYFAHFEFDAASAGACREQTVIALTREASDEFELKTAALSDANPSLLFRAGKRDLGEARVDLSLTRDPDRGRFVVVIAVFGQPHPTRLSTEIAVQLSARIKEVIPEREFRFVQTTGGDRALDSRN